MKIKDIPECETKGDYLSDKEKIALLRTALVGLVGSDNDNELKGMLIAFDLLAEVSSNQEVQKAKVAVQTLMLTR
jgi:hypothetical protein